jgi:hypothetical protein
MAGYPEKSRGKKRNNIEKSDGEPLQKIVNSQTSNS